MVSKKQYSDRSKLRGFVFFVFLIFPVFVKRLVSHKTPKLFWDGRYLVGLHQTGQVLPVIGNNDVAGATCLSTKPSDLLDGHLLLSTWDDKDVNNQDKQVFKLHEHGCPVSSDFTTRTTHEVNEQISSHCKAMGHLLPNK